MDGEYVPKPGEWVEIFKLDNEYLPGLFVSPERKARRRVGARGLVYGYVAGHGGDVWWVCHDGKTEKQTNPLTGETTEKYVDVAPYFTTEMRGIPKPEEAKS